MRPGYVKPQGRRTSAAAPRSRRHGPPAFRIGERRKPRPKGRSGFLRVDTVHQGDKDGEKDPAPVPNALPSGGRRCGTVCRFQKPTLNRPGSKPLYRRRSTLISLLENAPVGPGDGNGPGRRPLPRHRVGGEPGTGRQEGREEGRQLGRLDATRLMVRQCRRVPGRRGLSAPGLTSSSKPKLPHSRPLPDCL